MSKYFLFVVLFLWCVSFNPPVLLLSQKSLVTAFCPSSRPGSSSFQQRISQLYQSRLYSFYHNSTFMSPHVKSSIAGRMPPAEPALQNFFEKVIDLQEQGDSGVQLTNDDDIADSDIRINSLVFRLEPFDTDTDAAPIPRGFPTPQASYVLAVLASKDFVNTSRLEEVVLSQLGMEADERRPLLTLAPSSQVAELCGFEPGRVPPFGLSPSPVLTVVDQSLLHQSRFWMLGSGGMPAQTCRFQLDVLLGLDGVVMEGIRDQRNRVSESNVIIPESTAPVPPFSASSSTIKPFFPAETPPLDVAKQVVADSTSTIPLSPTEVSFVGRLARVRRMARRLVFCDIVPLEAEEQTTSDESKVEHTWRSAVTGQDMSVQLIAGKTLCQRLGTEQGEQMLRRGMQPGQIVWIRGKTNVGNRESLRNWVDKQSMDIVVWDCTLMTPQTSAVGLPSPPPTTTNPQDSFFKHSKSTMSIKTNGSSKTYDHNKQVFLPPGMTHLRWEHAFSLERQVIVVDSIEQVRQFRQNMIDLMAKDENAVELTGLDCEWKPNFLLESKAEEQPALVLQISLHSLEKVYLWDLQALLRPLLDPIEPMTAVEEEISQVFSAFFGSTSFIKVGFQLINDIRRLAASYPHIKGFTTVEAVLELSTVAKKSMFLSQQSNSRTVTSSLRTMVQHFLGYGLDKTEQTSDWSQRPLTDSQKEYAALDAAVAPLLLKKVLLPIHARVLAEPSLQLGRWTDDTAFSRAIRSWRFLFLDPHNSVAIKRLQAKRTVGDGVYVVSQSWRTGGVQPPEPSVPTEEGPFTDASGVYRIPAKLVYLQEHEEQILNVIHRHLGKRLAKSKDRCVAAVMEAVPTMAEQIGSGARLDFQPRSGYVEFGDASVLFVNMPMRPWARKARSYPNEWMEDGQILTWFLRENEWKGGTTPLAKKLLDPNCPVFLFVRVGKGHFLCCGRCKVTADALNATTKRTWDLVKLFLTLLDWKDLNGSPEFLELVHPGKYAFDDLCSPRYDNEGDDDSSINRPNGDGSMDRE